MPRKIDAVVARTIGIDTGKNTLHLIGLDEKGAIILRENHLLSVFYTISIGAAAVSPPAAGFLSDLIGIPGTITIVSALTLATIPCAFLLKDLRHTEA